MRMILMFEVFAITTKILLQWGNIMFDENTAFCESEKSTHKI
jgi:hypothetical protein